MLSRVLTFKGSNGNKREGREKEEGRKKGRGKEGSGCREERVISITE